MFWPSTWKFRVGFQAKLLPTTCGRSREQWLGNGGRKLHLIKICLAAFWFIYCWMDQISLIKLLLQLEEVFKFGNEALNKSNAAILLTLNKYWLNNQYHAACKRGMITKYQQSNNIPTQPEQMLKLLT